ncbi:MAG: energy transducer TonB [Candidatus Kapaibacterium sp.]
MRYSYPLVLCGVLLLAGCAHGRSQNTPKSDVAAQPGNAAKQDGPDEFIMVDKDPTWDQADLQRRIQYPEDAWRNNIEGRVFVRVLIDRQGHVVETRIDRSDDPLLTPAAVKAVTETVFTPAMQHDQPVMLWVQIPVTFKLSTH